MTGVQTCALPILSTFNHEVNGPDSSIWGELKTQDVHKSNLPSPFWGLRKRNILRQREDFTLLLPFSYLACLLISRLLPTSTFHFLYFLSLPGTECSLKIPEIQWRKMRWGIISLIFRSTCLFSARSHYSPCGMAQDDVAETEIGRASCRERVSSPV